MLASQQWLSVGPSILALVLTAACSASVATPAAGGGPGAASVPGQSIPADWPNELDCGLFGGDDAEAALQNNRPVAEYLAQQIGIPIRYTIGTSYNAVIEAMRAKRTHCGTVGPFSYILAVQEAGAEALAINVSTRANPAVYDPAIRPAYFSVISVKKGRGITSLEDLRGKSFSFVDPASTSGHLIPKALLLKNGIDPDEDMRPIFAGSHPSSAVALWNDKVDAAASTETTLYNLAENNQIEFCGFSDGRVGLDRKPEDLKALFDACPDGKVAMLAMSDPIPNSPFSVRSDLPASLKHALKQALLKTKDDPDFIAATGRWYVDPAPERGLSHLDHYYDPLREVAKMLDLDLRSLE